MGEARRYFMGVLPHWPQLVQHHIQDFKSVHYTVMALVYFAFWTFINTISQVVTQYRMPDLPPLRDAGFEYLPYITIENFTNYYLFLIFFVTFCRFAGTGRGLRMMTRFMMLEGSAFAVRGLLIYVTSLPNPYEYCKATTDPNDSIAYNAFMIATGNRLTCGDCIPSGHTFFLTNMGFMWWDHTRFLPLKIIMFTACAGGWFVIIMTHFHYSIDVTCGVLLAVLVRFVSCRACGIPFFKHSHGGIPHTLCRYDGHNLENVDTDQLSLALHTHRRLSVSQSEYGSEYTPGSASGRSSSYRRGSAVSGGTGVGVGNVKRKVTELSEKLNEPSV